MQRTCWILGVDEEQRRDMLPGTISMGFPLVGDLGRFRCVAAEDDPEDDDPETERRRRRSLVADFRLAYPGVLEAREHAARRLADPFGLWLFSKKTRPHELVVVHVEKGKYREAVAIAEVTGPYFFLRSSSWPHRLPVATLNLERWMLPSPYSRWGDLFAMSSGRQSAAGHTGGTHRQTTDGWGAGRRPDLLNAAGPTQARRASGSAEAPLAAATIRLNGEGHEGRRRLQPR